MCLNIKIYPTLKNIVFSLVKYEQQKKESFWSKFGKNYIASQQKYTEETQQILTYKFYL